MMLSDNKLLYNSLIFSLAMHSMLILGFSMSKKNIILKPAQKVEITYATLKAKSIIDHSVPDHAKVIEPADLPKEIKAMSKMNDSLAPASQAINDISKLSDKIMIEQKNSPRINTLDTQRKISVPILNAEKISNPRYISYNDSIRQKIKQRAYSYIDHPDFESGEVYLTFIIKSDGTLQDTKIIEAKTKANNYLRQVGLRSIKDANPFPPFPKDLGYPELTFNVVISFEVEKN